MAARSKARTLFCRLNTGIVVSNQARGKDMCVCIILFCVVLYRYRPCVWPILRARRPAIYPSRFIYFKI